VRLSAVILLLEKYGSTVGELEVGFTFCVFHLFARIHAHTSAKRRRPLLVGFTLHRRRPGCYNVILVCKKHVARIVVSLIYRYMAEILIKLIRPRSL
jgi:hypothetical protein